MESWVEDSIKGNHSMAENSSTRGLQASEVGGNGSEGANGGFPGGEG